MTQPTGKDHRHSDPSAAHIPDAILTEEHVCPACGHPNLDEQPGPTRVSGGHSTQFVFDECHLCGYRSSLRPRT